MGRKVKYNKLFFHQLQRIFNPITTDRYHLCYTEFKIIERWTSNMGAALSVLGFV